MNAQDDAAQWRAGRREAAAAHADALRRKQEAESAQARELIAAFVRDAAVHGPAPEPLRAYTYDGRSRLRTPLRGWYLRLDESIGIDTDGRFYLLRAPRSIGGLLRGVTPAASDPPLVLGAGGKDGESIDLADALARLVAAR